MFASLLVVSIGSLPLLGREFMPSLEEGHIWVRGWFPVSVSLAQTTEKNAIAREIMTSYPEVQLAVSQMGPPDDGVDPSSFYSAETLVPLKPFETWPATVQETGWRRLFRDKRPRTKVELIDEMSARLNEILPGVNWTFTQTIRDTVLESLSGVQGENSVKIIGPELDELEAIGQKAVTAMQGIPGIREIGLYRIRGQVNLELPIDRRKCALWNIKPADVHTVIQCAIGGQAVSQMIEGERSFDITIRWPEHLLGRNRDS